jgi:hypothetical protein
MPPRRPLTGPHARQLETLLGLEPWSLRAVGRRTNGDYALELRGQRVGRHWARVLRIPAKRVHGYHRRSATARPCDVRYRHRKNARSFAFWLADRHGWDVPVVRAAIWERDLEAVDELRAAILLAASGGAATVEAWLEWETS